MAIFKNYESNITRLQQNNVLTIAKAVAGNLQSYYINSCNSFNTYFNSVDSVKEVQTYFENQQEGISGIVLLSEQGEIVSYWGKDYGSFICQAFDDSFCNKSDQTILLSPTQVEGNHFVQFMYKPIMIATTQYFVVASIETETIYNQIVKPIKVGSSGYSMVKNIQGIILMHSAKNQIGLDAVEGRIALYSDRELDLSDLKDWIEEQKNNNEGTRILNSYWWNDPKVPESKKVVAFTKVRVGNDIWIVNSTLDYQELAEPIKRTREMVTAVSIIIIAVFFVLIYQVFNNVNIQKTMSLELDHLQEMNLTLQKLQKSKEMLRHTERISTIGSMTSMIAHEFNNYLTPIRLYGELISTDLDVNDQILEYAGEILQAAGKAGELTKELSVFGRRDGEQNPSVMPLIEQIERSLSLVRKTLPDNISLIVDLQGENLYIRTLLGMVNQVMINLCTNAIHSMEKEGGTLEVRGIMESDVLSPNYCISVIDTGTGMPEDVLVQIFQPFFTTKEAGTGTGLGLAIIKDLIHQVGGTITASSKQGLGSRFDIRLPLYNISQSVSFSKKLRILILDDQKTAGKAIEKLLQERYQTDLFFHPYKALEVLRKHPERWDVILTDYSMPALNGTEFSAMIRRWEVTVPVILMTGYVELDVQQYLSKGIIDGIIEKPVDIEKFQEILDSQHFFNS